MKLRYLFLSLIIAHNNTSAMLAAAGALAANPEVDALVETIGSTAINAFAHSSTFASLTNNSHSSQVVAGLQALAPQVGSAAAATIASGGALPTLPANNATQQALGLALNAANQAETSLATNPSVKAKVCRILLGMCMAGVGAADLITNYVYTQKATEEGKQATSSVLGTPLDLTVMGSGLYQVYLGIINWDTVAKQADAATATKLVQGHIAQLAAPGAVSAAAAAAAAPAGSASV